MSAAFIIPQQLYTTRSTRRARRRVLQSESIVKVFDDTRMDFDVNRVIDIRLILDIFD